MTKVVFQNGLYVSSQAFGDDVAKSGVSPVKISFNPDGTPVVENVAWIDVRSEFKGRIGGFSYGCHKSVSVFATAFEENTLGTLTKELFKKAVIEAAVSFATNMKARAGAQGRNRLPCHPTIHVFFHTTTVDGLPHLHAHVYAMQKVQVPSLQKQLSADYRELYRNREEFSARVASQLAFDLKRQLGVRVESRRPGQLQLPDVPKALLEVAADRTKKIDFFLQTHNLPSTGRTRAFAALATRREAVSKDEGRRVFQDAVRKFHFQSEQICQRFQSPSRNDTDKKILREVPLEAVVSASNRLARKTGFFSQGDLNVSVMQKMLGQASPKQVEAAVVQVLRQPQQHGIKEEPAKGRETLYSTPDSIHAVAKLYREAKLWRANPESRERFSERVRDEAAKSREGIQAETKKPLLERLKESRIVVAFGEQAKKIREQLKAILMEKTVPVYQANARLKNGEPGSFGNMVRDLRKRWLLRSQQEAVKSMTKINARGILKTLGYGEHVFKLAFGTSKYRLKKEHIVVVSHARFAKRKDLAFVRKLVQKAGCKLILSDRQVSEERAREIGEKMARREERSIKYRPRFQRKEQER